MRSSLTCALCVACLLACFFVAHSIRTHANELTVGRKKQQRKKRHEILIGYDEKMLSLSLSINVLSLLFFLSPPPPPPQHSCIICNNLNRNDGKRVLHVRFHFLDSRSQSLSLSLSLQAIVVFTVFSLHHHVSSATRPITARKFCKLATPMQ